MTDVDPHRAGLELYCHLMLGCPRDAEKAVQETLLRASRAPKRLDDLTSTRIWLYRIATSLCLDEIERRQVTDELAPPGTS